MLEQSKERNTSVSFIFRSRGGDSEVYVSRALGKDELRSETKGPDGPEGPHHLPGCNLKREPTGTDVASSGVISTLLDYARIYTSGSPFTLAPLSPNVSLLCTRVYAPPDIFDILTVRRRAPRGWTVWMRPVYFHSHPRRERSYEHFSFNGYSRKRRAYVRAKAREFGVGKLFDVVILLLTFRRVWTARSFLQFLPYPRFLECRKFREEAFELRSQENVSRISAPKWSPMRFKSRLYVHVLFERWRGWRILSTVPLNSRARRCWSNRV